MGGGGDGGGEKGRGGRVDMNHAAVFLGFFLGHPRRQRHRCECWPCSLSASTHEQVNEEHSRELTIPVVRRFCCIQENEGLQISKYTDTQWAEGTYITRRTGQ